MRVRAGTLGNFQLGRGRFPHRHDRILAGGKFGEPLLGPGLLLHRLELAVVELVAVCIERFDLVVQRVGLASLGHDLQLLLEASPFGREDFGLVLDRLDRGLRLAHLRAGGGDRGAMLGELSLCSGERLSLRQTSQSPLQLMKRRVELLESPQ